MTKDELHLAFLDFCQGNNLQNFTKERFFKKLMEKDISGVRGSRTLKRGHADKPVRIHVIRGLDWKPGKRLSAQKMRELKEDYLADLDDQNDGANVVQLSLRMSDGD